MGSAWDVETACPPLLVQRLRAPTVGFRVAPEPVSRLRRPVGANPTAGSATGARCAPYVLRGTCPGDIFARSIGARKDMGGARWVTWEKEVLRHHTLHRRLHHAVAATHRRRGFTDDVLETPAGGQDNVLDLLIKANAVRDAATAALPTTATNAARTHGKTIRNLLSAGVKQYDMVLHRVLPPMCTPAESPLSIQRISPTQHSGQCTTVGTAETTVGAQVDSGLGTATPPATVHGLMPANGGSISLQVRHHIQSAVTQVLGSCGYPMTLHELHFAVMPVLHANVAPGCSTTGTQVDASGDDHVALDAPTLSFQHVVSVVVACEDFIVYDASCPNALARPEELVRVELRNPFTLESDTVDPTYCKPLPTPLIPTPYDTLRNE